MQRISIYWEKDSHDLMNIPVDKALICGNDGMELLGSDTEIDAIVDYLENNAERFRYETEHLSNSEAQAYFKTIRKFNREFADNSDDLVFFDRFDADLEEWYLLLYVTPHGKRYWEVAGSIEDDAIVFFSDVSSYTRDRSLAYCRDEIGADGWIDGGMDWVIDNQEHGWKPDPQQSLDQLSVTLRHDLAETNDEIAALVERVITDADVDVWHSGEGEFSKDFLDLLDLLAKANVTLQVWGSRTGVEPLSIIVG